MGFRICGLGFRIWGFGLGAHNGKSDKKMEHELETAEIKSQELEMKRMLLNHLRFWVSQYWNMKWQKARNIKWIPGPYYIRVIQAAKSLNNVTKS